MQRKMVEINSVKIDSSKVNDDKTLGDSKNENMNQSGQMNFSQGNMIINNNNYSHTPSGQINSNNLLMNNSLKFYAFLLHIHILYIRLREFLLFYGIWICDIN